MDTAAQSEDGNYQGDTMKTSVIEIDDMLSVLSVEGVKKRISKVPGVESATVNFASGNATMRYDETRLDIADIKSGVRKFGNEADDAPAADSAGKGHGGHAAPEAPPATPAPAALKTPAAAPTTVGAASAGAAPSTTPKPSPAAPAVVPAAPKPAPAGDGQKDKALPDKN